MWKMKNRYCITVIITLPTPFPPVRKNKLGFLKNHCPVGGIVNLNSKDLGLGCFVAKSCQTLLWPHGLQSARLLSPWNFPEKNIGVGCHFLLQRIFLTHRSNLRLLVGTRILYHWAMWEDQNSNGLLLNKGIIKAHHSASYDGSFSRSLKWETFYFSW